MRRRYVLMGLAAIATLSLALPAMGAPSPVKLAKKALGIAKKANKSAKTANTSANQALDQIRNGVPRAQSADSAKHATSAGSANIANSAKDADKLDGKDSSEFAGSSHNHDDRYYTEAEVNEAVAAAKDDAWAYVISNGGLHASSGANITVTKPATGEYCVVVPRRSSHKAAQATLADPGGNKIVSVGTGHGSACNPLSTATHDAVPVYVRTTGNVAVDGNFTIAIPAP